MRILWRYVALEYLKAFAASLVAVTSIYLVVDFVDRAKIYSGPGWQAAAAALYGYKALTVGYQLAPASLLLAGGVALSGLRRRGEYVALRSLAIGPWSLYLPVLATGLLLASGLVAADELVIGKAGRRVDEIAAHRFHFYGDFRTYFGRNPWFHGRRYVYHLRDIEPDGSFDDVTLFALSDDFRLSERIDAKRMVPAGGKAWTLLDGAAREIRGQEARLSSFSERTLQLDEDPAAFRIAQGRPEQMRFLEVRRQIAVRAQVGLPSAVYVLALHNKLAYPLGGIPGALLACALSLRPGRRGYMTAALAEGFFLIVVFWALLVVCKASVVAGGLSPAMAAWLPGALFFAAAAAAVRTVAR